MNSRSDLATPELRAVKGGWMAISAPGSRLRIAVIGESKNEALERFAEELQAWAVLEESEAV